MRKLLLLTMLAFAMSCSKDAGTNSTSTPSMIQLSRYYWTCDAIGGTETLYIYVSGGSYDANFQWALSGGESWCIPSAINGTAGASGSAITITVSENTTTDEREATLKFMSGDVFSELTITQKQKDALTVTSSKIEVDATGGLATIEVKANISYEYEIAKGCKDWITPKETRAVQTTTLTFDIAKNTKMEKREGTITIFSGKISETITITQAEEKPTITVPQNKFNISGDGETIEVEINSNVDLEIIPEADWIRETQTRTISSHKKYFVISANSATQPRTGEINITSRMYDVIPARVTINQAAASYVTVHVSQKGTLESVLTNKGLDNNSLISLKITGELNDVDFLSINHIMPNLRSLDIAEVNITTLPEKAFDNSQNVENVILPNTLTTIGKEMFSGSHLRSITIPNGVTAIETSAFRKCGLTSINIPMSVKTIETEAFSFCSSLASVKISAGVETIGKSAFLFCSNLTKVTFEKNSQLKTIGGGYECYATAGTCAYLGAFSHCRSLTSIEIPASVETIESTAFKDCSALSVVTFEKNSRLKIIKGGSFSYKDSSWESPYHHYSFGVFSDCTSLITIEIPANVETIETEAFSGCSALTAITFEQNSKLKTIEGEHVLSNSSLRGYYYGAFSELINLTTVDMSGCTQVESLGVGAFSGSSALQLFKIGTPTPPTCGVEAFGPLNSNSVLQVPSGCATAYKTASEWNRFATVTIK